MKTSITLFASLILSSIAHSADWSSNFNLPAVNGSVLAIAETPDAFYYGGAFTQVGSVAANNIVRVDKTTGAITPLGSATQNGTGGFLPTSPADVRAIAVIGTDLYVAGSFNKVSSSTQNAITANLIAKWSTTTNTWSPLGSASQNGTAGGINALTVSGTDLYVGGQFSTMKSSTQSGVSANRVAKWDTLTGLWSPLGSASQNGVQSGTAVRALAVSGQDLYVGGTFSNVSSSTQVAIAAKFIAKWDISGGTWSPLGSAAQNGTSTIVDVLAVNGTDVYAGGSFDTVSSSTQNAISAFGVAKWDSAAEVWVPLGSGTQNGINDWAMSLAVSGTSLYVGGLFYEVKSATQSSLAAKNIACWDMVAGTWSALGEGTKLGTGTVKALAVSGADLHAGGDFREIGGILNTSGIGKWSITANSWGPAVPVVPGDGIIGNVGTVNTVVDAGSVVYVGGYFDYAGGVAANNIACWNKATRTWSVLGSAAQNGTNKGVEVMILIGTELYVGGAFTSVSSSSQNGVSVGNIAKWDTINGVWSPLGSASQNGTNAFGFVNAFAVIGDVLFVGGSFTTVSSSTQSAISAKGIGRWSLSQETWSPLGTGAQNGLAGTVYGLAVSGNDLYVGGFFSTVSSSTQNGISANNVARWSTETSEWSSLGSAAQNGTNNTVKSLAAKGGSIYVGGNFFTVSSSTQSSISARRVARWDVAGSTWAPLGSASQNGTASNVEAMVMRSGDLYVAGGFSSVSSATQNSISAKGVVRWNETTGTWSQLGSATQNGVSGGSATVDALALSGTDLYVGGYFDSVSSDTQNAIASQRVGIYGPVPAPDISVEQPAGTPLTDGTASISFGGVVMASNSAPVTFTVKNPGTTDLTLAAISKDGAHPGDFTVDTTGMLTTLAPGGSTTFTVVFNPSTQGARSAALHIASDVAGSKNPFDIALTGTGTSTNADLSGLSLSSGTLSPAFDSATTAYTASVANATTSITVTPTRAQPNATIEVRVNGGAYAPVTSGSPSGSLALNVGANTVDIRITAQAGNTKTYTTTVTRDKATQTITFVAITDKTTIQTVALSATGGGSPNPVAFSATGPATINGSNVLSFTGAGSVTVTASQAGDANYHAATPVAHTFNVTKAMGTVNLSGLAQTYDGNAKPVGATTDPAGKTVTFTYDGSSTAPTNAGSYAVVGTINDAIYQGSATDTLVVSKGAQSITFVTPGPRNATESVPLSATGGASLNPVTFAVTGPGVLTGNTLTFTGAGSVTVTASQVGNANYLAALDVAHTFTVSHSATVTLTELHQVSDGSPRVVIATTDPPDLDVAVTYAGNPTAPTAMGSYAVLATITDPRYEGSANGTLVVDDPATMTLVNGGQLPAISALGALDVETYQIARYEVTRGFWNTVRDWAIANGYDLAAIGDGSADDHPVHSLNWYDAIKWCNARTEWENATFGRSLAPAYRVGPDVYRSGEPTPTTILLDKGTSGYRFTAESEWELAARGGTSGTGKTYSGGNDPDLVAWHAGNSGGAIVDLSGGRGTWPAGRKAANELGLYDLSGNVAEWVEGANPGNPSTRYLLGGSWNGAASESVIGALNSAAPSNRLNTNGLRVGRSVAAAMAGAIDNDGLTWNSGGDAPWFAQTGTTHDTIDGIDAAESGALGEDEESWIETTVTGPGNLRFWWKSASVPNVDVLSFSIGANEAASLTGTVDWQERTVEIPAGDSVLRWRFARSSLATAGTSRAWLDQVVYTLATEPELTTAPATDVTETTATLGGEVTDDGGRAVTARGVVYTTMTAPTLADVVANAASGGTGIFSVSGTNLAPGTTYHVRAYATNAIGTGYGPEIVFTTGASANFVNGVATFSRSILPGGRHVFNFSLTGPRIVSLATLGDGALRAQLYDSEGNLITSFIGDTNFDLEELLLAGDYSLHVFRESDGGSAQTFELTIDSSVVAASRPDVEVGASAGALTGKSLYSPTSQLASLISKKLKPVTGHASVSNRGNLPDVLAVSGGRGSAFFKVDWYGPTGGNITAAMNAGTYRTAAMVEGTSPVSLSAKITPNKKKLTKTNKKTKRTTIVKKTFLLSLRAGSTFDPTISDAATIQVKTK